MSSKNIFSSTDYAIARDAARKLPQTANNSEVTLIAIQLMVPLLLYFLAHISEQRRGVKISSYFYLDSLQREAEVRCLILGDKNQEVLDEIMKLADATARKLWVPTRELSNYAPSEKIKQALVQFLQRQN